MSSSTFECGVCAADIDGAPEVLVDSSPTCESCVREVIIPKFQEALKYEASFPVLWGGGIVLNPQDFAKYFHDYTTFLQDWETKLIEYESPAKHRLYCKGCSTFLRRLPFGPETEYDQTAHCEKCETTVCGKCGSTGHTAADCTVSEEENPLAGFKDTKSCPNCGTAMFLYDGCNAIDCKGCQAKFCWVCLAVDPPRDHWYVGNPCPKWNNPGDENAQFLDPEQDAQMDREHPEVEIPDEILDFEVPEPNEQWRRIMIDLADLVLLPVGMDHEDLSPRAIQLVSSLREKYPLDDLEVPSDRETRRVRCEGVRMSHASIIRKARNAVPGREHRLVEGGVDVPAFNSLMLNLLKNTKMYHDRDANGRQVEQYLEQHLLVLENFHTVYDDKTLNFQFPRLMQVLVSYLIVAPERLAVAASHRHRFRLHHLFE